MNDNTIIPIIVTVLNDGYTALSIANVSVKQAYQPTQQGVPSNTTVYIHKIMAPRYGFPGNRSVYNSVDGDFDTTLSIWRTPTFQITAHSVQDPSNLTSLTASDIAEIGADILQTPATRQTLLGSDIGVLRIESVRVVYFSNDRDRHEQEASFDVTFTYRRTQTLKTPRIVRADANIQRV